MALFVLARPSSARLRALIALVAGAVLAASFAPLSLWPLAVLCPALLMWLWQDASARESAWLGFFFTARESEEWTVRMYQEWGKPDKAAEWQSKLQAAKRP